MVPAIASPRIDPAEDARDLALRWSGRVSLTTRILAVNVVALLMLAGGFFYLDSYRSRLLDNRAMQAMREARLVAEAIGTAPAGDRDRLVVRLARDTGTRLRLYDAGQDVVADSRALGLANFALRDPDRQPFKRSVARFLDRVIDTVVFAQRPPLYRDRARDWPDVTRVLAQGGAAATIWRAPDRTPVVTAAAPLRGGGAVMTTVNARDVTQTVRSERFRLGIVLAVTTLVSVLLSLFLARTIVRPLRRLARAAVRVRLGRAREVVVPRLPDRRDELGLLARALSDMTIALRARIDATEAFAADLTHELKNPLASLRSAVDGLARVADPALQARLLEIVADDVRRLDRLITDISEASRLDALLSRAKFEPIDLAAMLAALVAQRAARGTERGVALRLDPIETAPLLVSGDGARLVRVFENLAENAISFSPEGACVTVAARRDGGMMVVTVDDEGPGVPDDAREAIFRRFHSVRPEGEAFGQHSGLGLAIARTIVEGHGGTIRVVPPAADATGARFEVRLPAIVPE